jgi:hypothetical protein
LRYDSREWLARIFDPESYPYGSFWEAFGEAIRDRIRSVQHSEMQIGSPSRRYDLGVHLASGDLCDVRLATSGPHTYVLKTPRATTCDHLLETEQMVLRQLHEQSDGDHYGRYFAVPIESFHASGRTVSVFAWREGLFSGSQIRRQYPTGVQPRHLAWMFNRILEALGYVHQAGWIHGAVLPPHLLFDTENHALQLIGWIHATRLNSPLQIVSRQYKSWYPRECHQRKGATPSTDIRLAAKSMVWLAGGDPLSEQPLECLPVEFGHFLRECITARSPHADDAWALHEEFRELLEDLYGPPKFCHLNMS